MIKRQTRAERRIYFDPRYYNIVKGILNSPEFQKRKTYKHHDDCSVFEHCLSVSYISYRYCRKLKLNYRDAAIGGLLHDFYETPWQDDLTSKKPFFQQHGFIHAGNALDNAVKYFPEYINSRVSDIILRHMFPLNVHPPRYPESWVVTFVDKKVSMGILKPNKNFLKYVGLAKYFNKINQK